MKILITGGCGFLGSNIGASILQNKIGDLFVLDNLERLGSQANYQWLQQQGTFKFYHKDIRHTYDVAKVIEEIKPSVIFHLAGQVAMTTSIEDPYKDFSVNALGSFNVLDAVRRYVPSAAVIYSSTNKVYGDLESISYEETATRYEAREYPAGFSETVPLDFHSPYGCSKGSADQYMLDWARIYGLRTAVFRHSSMYGGRQFATYDQGWVGWFVQQAYEQSQSKEAPAFTISGNGKQVRDLLHADDMVRLYLKAAEKIDVIKGQSFNIGGGMHNSFSLLELFNFLENHLAIKLRYDKLPPRESDQKVFVANINKARELLGWQPQVSKEEGVIRMLKWTAENKRNT